MDLGTIRIVSAMDFGAITQKKLNNQNDVGSKSGNQLKLRENKWQGLWISPPAPPIKSRAALWVLAITIPGFAALAYAKALWWQWMILAVLAVFFEFSVRDRPK
jgi:hypothetical protein